MPSSGEREELARVIAVQMWPGEWVGTGWGGTPPGFRNRCLDAASDVLTWLRGRASGWLPISEATRETCAEILGVQFAGGRMMREPFISFWSPTLNKFYCDPTHFMLLPPSPEDAKS